MNSFNHTTLNFDLPLDIIRDAESFFPPSVLMEGKKLFQKKRTNISFRKGSADRYFIVSGIVKAERHYESKLVFKKDGEGAQINSQCTCWQWNKEEHCPHVAALFFSFHLQEQYQKGGHLPNFLTHAAQANEYGTIVNGAHHLINAPNNATYSSLQYLLTNNKMIDFPMPQNWEGKLLIYPQTDLSYRFSYQNRSGEEIQPISLFEQHYLFDWQNGYAFHLPNALKDLIQKMRYNNHNLTLQNVIAMIYAQQLDQLCEVILDNLPLSQWERPETNLRIHLTPDPKKQLINLAMIFHHQEKSVPPPAFLSALTFAGGLLNSFRKKSDVYPFLRNLYRFIEDSSGQYRKDLIGSSKKEEWPELINTIANPLSIVPAPNSPTLYLYDNTLIKMIFQALISSFGELAFRFSEYHADTFEIRYKIPGSTIFQGLAAFQHQLSPFGVTIFYERSEIAIWRSQIRFERKSSTTNWFDLELNIDDYDLEILQNADLESGISLSSKGLVILNNDQRDLARFIKKYTELEQEAELVENGIRKFVLPFKKVRIFELFELKRLGIEGALSTEEEELCRKLSTLSELPEYPISEELQPIIRPYQKIGHHWLNFLYQHRLGACLADDMGLGKTLQAISFIQSIEKAIGQVLVVCPVTIILNWENEIKKFSSLTCAIYHGGVRHIPEDTKIIITSYGVMKKEAETTFSNKNFDILILDEVQHLKNLRSLGAFAARKINANFRICLTGTPVENDLSEFYNIIDLAVPGIWGDLQFIRAESNRKTRLLARRTARPFILRRTKAQVLHELPPKIENNIHLHFTDTELLTYKKTLQQIRLKINAAVSKKKYGEILKGLLELRQRCLWQKYDGENIEADIGLKQIYSTKIKFLIENLQQIIDAGNKAIVFSQFTTYLDIIQRALHEKHWKLARIDGTQSMKKRQQQIELFQNGDAPVFLISLKAGGVGLNLTAASYVFIMDPWWNPAVESQAIDRAHRIGQTNTLTVYRPIIKGSVEEKVLELQRIKKELFNDLLPENDEQYFTGRLTMKDFEHLFEESDFEI